MILKQNYWVSCIPNVSALYFSDVDECQKYGRKICGNVQCANTPGSYHCDCVQGFVIGKSETYCQGLITVIFTLFQT